MSKAGSRSIAFTASATDSACSTVCPLRARIFSTPLHTIRSSSTTSTRITFVWVVMALTSVRSPGNLISKFVPYLDRMSVRPV